LDSLEEDEEKWLVLPAQRESLEFLNLYFQEGIKKGMKLGKDIGQGQEHSEKVITGLEVPLKELNKGAKNLVLGIEK